MANNKDERTERDALVVAIGDAIYAWQREEPVVSPERIAVATGACVSTVFRWKKEGTARLEPRVSDLVLMERLKPGLLARVEKLVAAKKSKR